jgi:membrane protein implicated in regulation of membrane protease activity
MFSDFPAWWSALELLEKIYWGVAIPFTLFFSLQLILTFFGGDVPEDGGADFDVESNDGIGFQFFTLKNLVAFFTIFAWTGIACLDSGLSNGTSIIVSFIAGVAMMGIMGSIFYFLSKATASGTLKMKNAIGAVGEVYMEIKAKRGNMGKVQVQVQGTLRTLDAVTDDDEDLGQGAIVNVTSIANNTILIVTKSIS